MLINFIQLKIENLTFYPSKQYNLKWNASKNALIELIYALHISNSITEENIKQIARVFEFVFDINLGDIHNAFHKMKYREKGVALFLDKLKFYLETHIQENE